MRITRLRGWSVGAEKTFIPDEEDHVWTLTFTETHPPTGEQLIFEMNRDTRDALVRALTDGIVLAGGDFPRL